MPRHSTLHRPTAYRQRGASLIMIMLILIVVSIVGVGGIQIAMMSERSARNDRDMQVAWQAAEEGLIDAENDITGPATSTRRDKFDSKNISVFIAGCGTGDAVGLCSMVTSGKPAWLTVDFTSNTNTAYLGQFTSRTLPNAGSAASKGVQPFRAPNYVVEPIADTWLERNMSVPSSLYVYRVTAMGFGPRQDIQAVVQMIYRP